VPSDRVALSRMGWKAFSKAESCFEYAACCLAIEDGESLCEGAYAMLNAVRL